MRLLKNIGGWFTGKKAALIISIIIIFHLLFMLSLLQSNTHAVRAAKRSAVIQKIINAIYLVEATPEKNRKAAVDAMADPDIHVSFTPKPLWPLVFKQASFWKINRALEGSNIDSFAISIQLDTKQWLNINATIYAHALSKQLLFMLVELVVFGSIMIALWSINRFTKPLRKIKLSAERLGIDLQTKPLDIYGPTVVREVLLALNRMQQRILQLIRNRTLLLAAISHDLRTPIARARLRLQFIPDSEHKSQLKVDLEEMEKMISETLAFAREDSKEEAKKGIDLVSILQSICNDAADMGHLVTMTNNTQRVAFSGRPIALKRAFTNVINNAIRYAGNADVSIKKRGKVILIKVQDNGPGIKESDLDKVFEPFYRAEHSRSKDTGGTGLGLAVTRDIIRAHGGSIRLKNNKKRGLIVNIIFNYEQSSK